MGYICIILQKNEFVQKKSVFCYVMDLWLNSVRLETPNINEIKAFSYGQKTGYR